MGIVNRTPDSFYDRGATFGLESALVSAEQQIADGADIIDVGGIKGGPGVFVSATEEIERVVPFVQGLRARGHEVLISVDTFRAAVAEAVLDAGADIINDVTGLHDPDVLAVVAAYDAGYIAMHHGGQPRTRPFRRVYDPDATTAVVDHCAALTQRAIAAGIARDRLIVDPGHDFQKTTAQSLEVTRRLPELAALGFPVLVALSNKDFIGETLDAPIDQRVDGSLAAAVFSVLRGANIVRVHEVARTVATLQMTTALLGWTEPRRIARGLE
jgi:dihydropteroate synthase